jgi:hypothetical protein
MVSSTSYLNVYRVASAFPCFNRDYLLPVNIQLSLCPTSGVRAASCSVLFSRSNLLCYSLFIEDLV